MRGGTPPDVLFAPLFAPRTWQASRRVGFGSRALAVQLSPNLLDGRREAAAPTQLVSLGKLCIPR
jgi:hypothetical protein